MSTDALALNTAVWLLCALAWWFWGERRISSPLFLYLTFHLLSFVARPWFIYVRDDQSYLRRWIGIWPFAEHHSETMLLASLGLTMMTAGALLGERKARSHGTPKRVHSLDPGTVRVVGVVMLLLGVISYLRFGATPFASLASDAPTGQTIQSAAGYTAISTIPAYFTAFHLLIVGVFVCWICVFGLRWYYVPPLAAFLLAMIYTANSRTTYLVGGFALVLAVLGKQNRRWPSKRAALVLLLLLISFLAGKGWLQTLQREGVDAARQQISRNLNESLAGQSDLFLSYDMLVAVDYLVPRYASHTNLRLYARPLYFWVPRQLWPNKPIFDFAAAHIYSSVPQVSFQGLVVTLVGESFLAYGLPSVVILMFVFGFAFNYVHVRGYLAPAWSVERILTIAFVAALVQVYRDGIVSLPPYMLFYAGPCLVMWFVSRLFGGGATAPTSRDRDGLPASPLRGLAVAGQRRE